MGNHIKKNAVTFYRRLGHLLRKNLKLFVFLIAISFSISLVDSIFFRKYYSEALITIPPYENSEFITSKTTNIQDIEQYFLINREALLSDKVLSDALSSLNPVQATSATDIESLRSDLSAMRLPFENTVALYLKTFRPDYAHSLLIAIIQSYEDWHRNYFVAKVNRLKQSILQELDKQKRQLVNSNDMLKTFETKNSASLIAEQLSSRKEAIEYLDSKLQNLQRFQNEQQDQPEESLENEIGANIKKNQSQIFHLIEIKSQIINDIQRLNALENIRSSLKINVDLVQQGARQLYAKLNDINLFISRSCHISINIMKSPSASKQINPLWLNSIRGVTTGLCLCFLLLYLMAIQAEWRNDQFSNNII